MSKLFGLIGFPVKHSYSAAMHNAAFKELGVDARYELFEVSPDRLEEEFKQLLQKGVCGFNITIPYKERIIKFLDRLDQQADLIGAVNTIKVDCASLHYLQKGAAGEAQTTKGFNTDGLGFIMHLTETVGFSPEDKIVSILGAGGAARAISIQLAKSKAKTISIFDSDQNKTKGLIAKLESTFSNCDIRAVGEPNALLQDKPDLLINATPVGMDRNDPLVFDSERFHPGLVVYDLIYNPAQTALLQEAKRKGCAAEFNGLGMLLYQGVLAFKIWLDVQPPVQAMERALRDILLK